MSKEFDAELDAIVGAYKAVTNQAAQQILDARTGIHKGMGRVPQ